MRKRARLAALVIGDEVLSGKVQDLNTGILTRRFFEHGVEVTRVEIVRDSLADIGEALVRLRATNDVVITTGGIGSTHDDVTYEAVANTWCDGQLERCSETLERMRRFIPEAELNSDRKRMSLLPKGCTRHWTNQERWVPVCEVNRTFVFPGIPSLFEAMLRDSMHLFPGCEPKRRHQVLTHHKEGYFAGALRQVAERHPSVSIGSYPAWQKDAQHTAQVTLEADDQEALDAALREVEQLLK